MLSGNVIKILIVDDDEDDYLILSDYVRSIEGCNFSIEWCQEYNEALGKIGDHNYDLYFVDYRLGHENGLQILEKVSKLSHYSPVVLLTGKGNKSIDIQAMKLGATDYLIKSDLTTEKLERCIRYSLDRAKGLNEIKASENKYRNLFEHSKDALFIADNGLKFKEVNQSACDLLLADKKFLLKESLFSFISNDSEKDIINNFLAADKNIAEFEIEMEDLNRHIKSCILSVSLQRNADGDQFVHGIIHDITNIKNAEKLNIQAQKLAANERLVRILAHEIRNPLNNIRLSADHLKLKEEKEKALITIIQRNSIRINQIITELLDSTRATDLIFEKHSIQDILEDSLASAMDRINLQNIKVNKEYTEQPLEIIADRSKLKIAFSNIMINAIEAMEPQKGQLNIGISNGNGKITVYVKDNGKGIPKEYISKLFEPFFTLKKNGMGLGLAAAFSIIQSHKGTMQVESNVNAGTKFLMNFETAV